MENHETITKTIMKNHGNHETTKINNHGGIMMAK
jgi:hypothetical protein